MWVPLYLCVTHDHRQLGEIMPSWVHHTCRCMCVCVWSWSCLCSVCMFASLDSVRGVVLFVLALGLALWKCWLAAMTQRYSIGKERTRESERERRRFRLSLLPKCATGLD